MQTCCYLHAFAPAVTRRRTGIRLGRRRQSRGGAVVPWPSVSTGCLPVSASTGTIFNGLNWFAKNNQTGFVSTGFIFYAKEWMTHTHLEQYTTNCLFIRRLIINNFFKPLSFLERRKHKVQERGFENLIAFSVLNRDFQMLTKMTLSQMNPSQSLTPCLFNICINIVFHCTPRFLKWSLRITILTKMLYTFLISRVCYIPCPSHASWFVHPNNVWQKCEAHQMCKLWH
jgi:hypothetical protein